MILCAANTGSYTCWLPFVAMTSGRPRGWWGEGKRKERGGETAAGYYLCCFMHRRNLGIDVKAVGRGVQAAYMRGVCLYVCSGYDEKLHKVTDWRSRARACLAKASLVTSQIVRGTHSCTSDDDPPQRPRTSTLHISGIAQANRPNIPI